MQILGNPIQKEFSKNANCYSQYSIIQKQVANDLLKKINIQYRKIIDLGCGDGEIFRQIKWEVDRFIAVDFSKDMLKIHPDSNNIKKYLLDLNSYNSLSKIGLLNFDLIVSSSSLQWVRDIEYFFQFIKSLNKPFAFAIFTSNTFKNIHNALLINSPIHSLSHIKQSYNRYFHNKIDTKTYTINFNSTKELLYHIKKTGVSGGGYNSLINLRKIIQENKIKTTTFEVVFLTNL